MTGRNLAATIVWAALAIVFCTGAFAQKNKEYPILKKYNKLGIVAGPAAYKSAKICPEYGNYTFENKPMPGYNAGFEYTFHPEKKWSFVTGLITALEPVYNVHFRFKEEDLYPQFADDLDDYYSKAYAINSFSAPLLARLNL